MMNRLSVEFIIKTKEEKDSSLYDKFIEKVIQHVGAVGTSVWDVSIEDLVQTIKDKDCTSQAQGIVSQTKMMMMMMSSGHLM